MAKSIPLYMSDELKQKVKEEAEKNRRSMSNMVNLILYDYFEKQSKKK